MSYVNVYNLLFSYRSDYISLKHILDYLRKF